MSFSLIDTHAHLTSPEVKTHEVLVRAKNHHISHIINICVDKPSLDKALSLTEKEPIIFHSAATCPDDAEKDEETFFPFVELAAKEKKLIAIGEIGLDYYHFASSKKAQQELLKKYLLLAKEYKLPVIIHCREAFDDLFSIIDSTYSSEYSAKKILLHCFTGSLQEAEKAIHRGWLISLSGILTFKNSTSLKEVAKNIPLEHLVLETDSPLLAPQKHRGKPNEPAYLIETAKVLAEVKETPLEIIAKTTSENAKRFFHIS
jgi:TatD DNase family protein